MGTYLKNLVQIHSSNSEYGYNDLVKGDKLIKTLGQTKDIYYFFHQVQKEFYQETPESDPVEIEVTYALPVVVNANSDYDAIVRETMKAYYGIKTDSSYIDLLETLYGEFYTNPYKSEHILLMNEIKAQLDSYGLFNRSNSKSSDNNSAISLTESLLAIQEIIGEGNLNLPDESIVKLKSFYKPWESFIGKSMKSGTVFTYNGSLYKAITDIDSVVSTWIPGSSTLSIYIPISEHSGTEADPIPYSKGMALKNSLYYMEDNILYICIRDCIPTLITLSELCELKYVTKV